MEWGASSGMAIAGGFVKVGWFLALSWSLGNIDIFQGPIPIPGHLPTDLSVMGVSCSNDAH